MDLQFSVPPSPDLAQRLTNALRNKVGDPAALIISHQGQQTSWGIDREGRVSEEDSVDDIRVPIGCMIKMYTATLVMLKCHELGVSLDVGIDELLGSPAAYPGFAGVTFRHLLQNTHGLDDPIYEAVPPTADGWLDVNALHARVNSVPRLFEPGGFYSYNDVGPVIAAAVLERIANASYRDLLRTTLLDRLDTPVPTEGHLCPSTGGPMTISATDLWKLARFHMPQPIGPRPQIDLAAMRENARTPPARTTLDMRACLGWNGHPGEWYGYIAAAKGASHLIRFNPDADSIVVIVSAKVPVYYFLLHALGDRMPECARPSSPPPQMLGLEDVHQAPIDDYIGSYACAALAMDVAKPPIPTRTGERLFVRIRDRFEYRKVLNQPIERPLRLGADDHLYTMPVEPRFLANGRFLERDSDGRCRYIWNGRQLWRRID
jgi:CubicO group peptidase (beta-lactamase class C family)